MRKTKAKKMVKTITHDDASRKNIPTAEYQSVMRKDEQDWSDLVVKVDHITREPEQVKAFRDTWRDGIHSYLTYLRDRLTSSKGFTD